jgi:hypothetical protein
LPHRLSYIKRCTQCLRVGCSERDTRALRLSRWGTTTVVWNRMGSIRGQKDLQDCRRHFKLRRSTWRNIDTKISTGRDRRPCGESVAMLNWAMEVADLFNTKGYICDLWTSNSGPEMPPSRKIPEKQETLRPDSQIQLSTD